MLYDRIFIRVPQVMLAALLVGITFMIQGCGDCDAATTPTSTTAPTTTSTTVPTSTNAPTSTTVPTGTCPDDWVQKLQASAKRMSSRFHMPVAMGYAGPDDKGGQCSMGFTVNPGGHSLWDNETCVVPDEHKADCGKRGTSKNECLSSGCCWALADHNRTGRKTPLCYHKQSNARNDFPMGSFTKVWTSSAILKLAKEGKIDLDEPAYKYMIRAHQSETNGANLSSKLGDDIKKVTIRQLLSMRGNILDYDELPYQKQHPTEDLGPSRTVELFGYKLMRTDRPLGSCGEYSSLGYVLLGLVLNGQAGQAWDRYDQNVWKEHFPRIRFGVHGTCSNYTDIEGLCDVCRPQTPVAMSCTGGYTCGNMVAPPEEVARFAQALFSGALLGDNLTAEMLDAKPLGAPGGSPGVNCDSFGNGALYGLGVELWNDQRFPGHEGITFGYTSLTKYDTQLEGAWVAAIATSNPDGQAMARAAWYDLYNHVRPPMKASQESILV